MPVIQPFQEDRVNLFFFIIYEIFFTVFSAFLSLLNNYPDLTKAIQWTEIIAWTL